MSEYKDCLKYIDNYWKRITYYNPKFDPDDKDVHVGLPNKFVSPNNKLFKKDQFYWDSYFIILGLIESGKIKLAKGMVDNFLRLFHKYKIIPSRNRIYNLGISQPPFLTSMILEIYNAVNNKIKEKNTANNKNKGKLNKGWLRKAAKIAERELNIYWKNENHLINRSLSRYCDHFVTHQTSEHESGWDMTSRFKEKCLNYLPVDLNSCLYKYEKDLAEMFRILNNKTKEEYYLQQAEKRKKNIIRLMWNEKKGFFFDYNYKEKKQSAFYSLAGFYPLWAGLASEKQAEKCRKNLKKFEYKGGLANTQKTNLSKEYKQWDYPNGWPNQQWIVIEGLLNYGFKYDAERIALKWLELNKEIFSKTRKFWEKYDVVRDSIGKSGSGRYPTQSGFGWTNAIFVKLVKVFKL